MDILTSQANNIAILKLRGRFDAYSAPSVERLLKSITNRMPANAIIDLGEVNFVDSTGLATILQGMKRCRQQKGDLYLCNIQPSTRIIFELTHFDRVFPIFETQEAAVQNFSKEQACNVSNYS